MPAAKRTCDLTQVRTCTCVLQKERGVAYPARFNAGTETSDGASDPCTLTRAPG